MLDTTYDKILIKKKEAEKFFDVSQSQLSKWIRQGGLDNMRGYVNVYELFIFWKQNIHGVEKLEANKTGEEVDAPVAEIKRKIQLEILRAKKTENDKEEDRLVEKDKVLSAWINRLSDLRTGLLGLKSRIKHKVVGKDEVKVGEIVDNEVDALFRHFSREGKFCNTNAEKGQ